MFKPVDGSCPDDDMFLLFTHYSNRCWVVVRQQLIRLITYKLPFTSSSVHVCASECALCDLDKQPKTALWDCRFFKLWSFSFFKEISMKNWAGLLFSVGCNSVQITQEKRKETLCDVSADDILAPGLDWLVNPTSAWVFVSFVCVWVCVSVCAHLALDDFIQGDVIADIIKLECQHPERNNTKHLITVRIVSSLITRQI